MVFAQNTTAKNTTVFTKYTSLFPPNTTLFAKNYTLLAQNTKVFTQNTTSKKELKWSKLVQNEPTCDKIVQTGSKWSKKCLKWFKMAIMVINSLSKIVHIGLKWSKIPINGPKYP